MKRWSKKHEKCRNCGTVRFKHYARGYCTRCYRLIKRLSQVDQWNHSDPNTLKGYPKNSHYFQSDIFMMLKTGYPKAIKRRLASLKAIEDKLAKPISGIDIEHLLEIISRKCLGKHRKLFHQTGNAFDDRFNEEQRILLYETLNKVVENIPFRHNLYDILKEGRRKLEGMGKNC